jgi:hypothetical protein
MAFQKMNLGHMILSDIISTCLRSSLSHALDRHSRTLFV